MMLSECQKFMFKTLDAAHAKTPLRSIQSREGECADNSILSKANNAQSYKTELYDFGAPKARNFPPLHHRLRCGWPPAIGLKEATGGIGLASPRLPGGSSP